MAIESVRAKSRVFWLKTTLAKGNQRFIDGCNMGWRHYCLMGCREQDNIYIPQRLPFKGIKREPAAEEEAVMREFICSFRSGFRVLERCFFYFLNVAFGYCR